MIAWSGALSSETGRLELSWFFTRVLEQLLFPPFSPLLIAAAGFLLVALRRRMGLWLLGFGLMAAYAFATPIVGLSLVRSLETVPALTEPLPEAQAIVILGGGIYQEAAEFGGDTVTSSTLERLMYGVHLYRATEKPVLVAGGVPGWQAEPEAVVMSRVLEAEFGVPVRWTETGSANTRENALLSAKLLGPEGITRIYLVTHALHMPRALAAFRAAGFDVVPAPTQFSRKIRLTLLDFLPGARGLSLTNAALHEWAGRLWYEIKE